MEIRLNREQLLPVVTRVVGVVERRQTLPILGNLLLQANNQGLRMVSTDLEVEVRGESPADVAEPGEVTVPARKFLDIVRNLPEGSSLNVKVSGERCVISSGRGRYVLGTLPASDFPVMQSEVGMDLIEVEEGKFRRLLEKTWFAMAQQDVRYYLNGLLLEFIPSGIRGVATDGHRLARFDLNGDLEIEGEGRSIIVPYKTVMELRRQLLGEGTPLRILVGEKSVRFEAGEFVTTTKLIDGRFPDYERVIAGDHGRSAILGKERLRGALVRASVLSNEKYKGVRMEFDGDVLRLQTHNPEQEEALEEIDVVCQGDPTTLGFNVSYLLDVLGAVEGEEVEVAFEDGNSSSVWRGVESMDETFVVMPMRL
jgi:DNA polymerase-3 subunit beta